jgi:hypothetical protein
MPAAASPATASLPSDSRETSPWRRGAAELTRKCAGKPHLPGDTPSPAGLVEIIRRGPSRTAIPPCRYWYA